MRVEWERIEREGERVYVESNMYREREYREYREYECSVRGGRGKREGDDDGGREWRRGSEIFGVVGCFFY